MTGSFLFFTVSIGQTRTLEFYAVYRAVFSYNGFCAYLTEPLRRLRNYPFMSE